MKSWEFSEEFFKLWGARVNSLDYSDYEGATDIHDLNQVITESLHKKFDVVPDSGTLEHVFNFPQAIENLMHMTKVSGHIVLILPANNFCGHGFYQFSPELFFRIFQPENSFQMKRFIMGENFRLFGKKWYETMDPDKVRSRVNLTNKVPTMAYMIAERVNDNEIFSTLPYQSDYQRKWDDNSGKTNTAKTSNLLPHAKKLFYKIQVANPHLARWLIGRNLVYREGNFKNRKYYKKVR